MSISSFNEKKCVVQGLCGWTDTTLINCGKFYPKSLKNGSERLNYYSNFGLFGCVEIDSTTYAIPEVKIVQSWVNNTPNGFIFHVKAFGMLCSGGIDVSHLPRDIKSLCSKQIGWITIKELGNDIEAKLWKRFNDSIHPIYANNKLGLVLFQYHTSFKPCEKSYQFIEYCARNLSSEYHMCIDFRNRAWIDETNLSNTINLLKSLRPEGIVLSASDDYEHEMKPIQNPYVDKDVDVNFNKIRLPIVLTTKSSSLCGYIRIHRRQGTNRVLTNQEYLEWSERIMMVFSESNCNIPIYLMWATDYNDQPITNAKNILNYLPNDIVFNWKEYLIESNKVNNFKDIRTFFNTQKSKRKLSDENEELSTYLTGKNTIDSNTNVTKPINQRNNQKKKSINNILNYFSKS